MRTGIPGDGVDQLIAPLIRIFRAWQEIRNADIDSSSDRRAWPNGRIGFLRFEVASNLDARLIQPPAADRTELSVNSAKSVFTMSLPFADGDTEITG